MLFKDILFISGQRGLYKYVSKGKNTVIVENLSDQIRSTFPATAKISMLDDIAVFTETEDVPLRKIFGKIQEKENGGATISHKSPEEEVKQYFALILPDYNREKVYLSDIRKVLMWYNALLTLGITVFEDASGDETATAPENADGK
jgi:hypothetical protein